MTKRRPLVAGLKKANGKQEREFVYGAGKTSASKSSPPTPEPIPEPEPPPPVEIPVVVPEAKHAVTTTRSPLTTRVRSDLFTALKRASLERQLQGQTPNTVQDILEEALEPWLREQGYLK